MPRGRDNFTPDEERRIRELLGRVREADRQQQKGLRADLRGLGFRISDWASDGSGFTVSDFDDLVERGLISIDSRDGVEWLVGLLRDVSEEQNVRERPLDPVGAELLIGDWSTIQRVALGRTADQLALCAWPGEQKPQALALYGGDRLARLLEFLDEHREWEAVPRPHLAFNNADTAERLYLTPSMDVGTYLTRWTEPDVYTEIGGHPPKGIRSELWPWLREEGFTDAAPAEDGRLDTYMERLERRRSSAHLRPGVELRRQWDWGEVVQIGREGLVGELRESLRELLEALQEPVLPRRADPA